MNPVHNSFCVLSQRRVCGPLFFNEKTAAVIAYLDMLQNYVLPQLNEFEHQDFIWQQDGAPPHFLHNVKDWFERCCSQRWIRRACPNYMVYSSWTPRSPDLTPYDPYYFFLWEYVKDRVYLPLLLVDLPDLTRRTVAAVESITPDMLTNVWEVFDFRLDVCRVTNGAHVEHVYRYSVK